MKMKKTAAKAAVKSTPTTSATPEAVAAAIAAPARALAPARAATPALAETTIDVKLDVGYGNALFLRGQGAGLNWERGVPLVCLDGKTWRWSQKVEAPITFKLLLNDRVWSTGNDLTIVPGQRLEIAPRFS